MRHTARRLGSRLYYEFTSAVLADSVGWERLVDSVAVEVRRHGAPAQSPALGMEGVAEAVPPDAVGEVVARQVLVAAAPKPHVSVALSPQAALAAAGAPVITVSSVRAHNNRTNSIVNNRSSNIINSNNTSNAITVVLS